MYFSPTNRISLKGEAYRSYFSTFSIIFLGVGRKVHFVTPDANCADQLWGSAVTGEGSGLWAWGVAAGIFLR